MATTTATITTTAVTTTMTATTSTTMTATTSTTATGPSSSTTPGPSVSTTPGPPISTTPGPTSSTTPGLSISTTSGVSISTTAGPSITPGPALPIAGPPPPTTGPYPPITSPPNPTTGPSNPTTGPSNPTTGPSNPTAGPSNPTAGPSNPTTGPSNPTAGPSNPTTGPSNPTTGPSNPTAGPTNPTAGPFNPTAGPSNPTAGPPPPAPAPASINYGCRAVKILDGSGRGVMYTVFRWGTPAKPPQTDLITYLNNLPATSTANFLSATSRERRFNSNQEQQIRNSNTGETFDITMLFAVIKLACENVAGLHDPVWHSSGTELENLLFMIKLQRNDIMHGQLAMTEIEFVNRAGTLRQLFIDTLMSAQQRYSRDSRELANEISMVNDNIDQIIAEPLGMDDLLMHFGPTVLQDFLREAVVHLKATTREDTLMDPMSFLIGNRVRLDVQKIFTKIMVCKGIRRRDEIDYENLLTLAQQGASSTTGVASRPQILLVNALAGGGKTTLVTLLTAEWLGGGQGTFNGLDTYQLMLRVQCRNSHLSSLADLLDDLLHPLFFRYGSLLPRLVKLCRLLIIVDGLDERNRNSRQLVTDLLDQFQEVPGCTFVCTSRPEALQDFLCTIPSRYEVTHAQLVGIPAGLRAEFVRRYFNEIIKVTNLQQPSMLTSQTSAPVPQTPAPAPQSSAPASQISVPAPQTSAPAPQSTVPTSHTSASFQQTSTLVQQPSTSISVHQPSSVSVQQPSTSASVQQPSTSASVQQSSPSLQQLLASTSVQQPSPSVQQPTTSTAVQQPSMSTSPSLQQSSASASVLASVQQPTAGGSNIPNIDDLIEKVEKDKYKEHFRLPLNLVILAWLFFYDPSTVNKTTTQTELYDLTHQLCQDKLEQRLAKNEHTQLMNRRSRINKVKTWLPHLYHKELQALSHDQLTLLEEVVNQLTSECISVGLPPDEVMAAFLSMRTTWTARAVLEQYQAPHKGFQDYYGALHIALVLIQQQQQQPSAPSMMERFMQFWRRKNTIKEVMNQSLGTEDVSLSKFQNTLQQLAGLLHLHLKPIPESLAKDVVDLLSQAGVKARSQWLDVLEDTRAVPAVLKAIAANFPRDNMIEVDDGRVESYVALLPLLPWSKVTVVLKGDPTSALQDLVPSLTQHDTTIVVRQDYLEQYMEILPHMPPFKVSVKIDKDPTGLVACLVPHTCTCLGLLHQYYHPYQTTLAPDRIMEQVFDRCVMEEFIGHLNPGPASKLPSGIKKLRVVLHSDSQAAVIPCLYRFKHLEEFDVHLATGVTVSSLTPLPDVKRYDPVRKKVPGVNLDVSDVGAGMEEEVAAKIAALSPKIGYSALSFPRATLGADGWKTLLEALARFEVKVGDYIEVCRRAVTTEEVASLNELAQSLLKCTGFFRMAESHHAVWE